MHTFTSTQKPILKKECHISQEQVNTLLDELSKKKIIKKTYNTSSCVRSR
jgi:predicted transcriptional regulator